MCFGLRNWTGRPKSYMYIRQSCQSKRGDTSSACLWVMSKWSAEIPRLFALDILLMINAQGDLLFLAKCTTYYCCLMVISAWLGKVWEVAHGSVPFMSATFTGSANQGVRLEPWCLKRQCWLCNSKCCLQIPFCASNLDSLHDHKTTCRHPAVVVSYDVAGWHVKSVQAPDPD